jgi:hypothetical protein
MLYKSGAYMMRMVLIAVAVGLFFGSCAIIPPNWWEDVPQQTPEMIYFVGASPENLSDAEARKLARADAENQAAAWQEGTRVTNTTTVHATNEETVFSSETEGTVHAHIKPLAMRYHRDSRKRIYVLVGLKVDPNPAQIPWGGYYKNIMGLWWNDVQSLHGLRINAFMGGWNFWYENDPGYRYSDVIGSLFGENERGKIYNTPIVGIGVRYPVWKVFIVHGAVSTSRISLGAGLGIPLGYDLFNITPWTTYNISWTNGLQFAPSFEGGIDIAYKRFILGGDMSVIPTKKWISLTYGITAGVKLW